MRTVRYAAQVSLVVSLGGLVQFLPICLPCEPSVTALCAIITAMHCVCRYEMLTQGSVTAYTCNDTKATKEPEMHGDLQEEPGLEPGAAAAPKEACNETKAAEEPEMQGDLQEESGLVPGAAAVSLLPPFDFFSSAPLLPFDFFFFFAKLRTLVVTAGTGRRQQRDAAGRSSRAVRASSIV